MAYTIQAIITSDSTSLGDLNERAIDLPQRLKIIPLNKELRQQFHIPWLPFTDEGFTESPTGIEQLGKMLSLEGCDVIYVEAELFGGNGMQAAIVWKGGIRTHGPVCGSSAINDALKLLGVSKGADIDEFEALELGRHRDTEEWIKQV